MIVVPGKGCRDKLVYINGIFILGMQECSWPGLFWAVVNAKLSKNFDGLTVLFTCSFAYGHTFSLDIVKYSGSECKNLIWPVGQQ